jgi:alanyl-tRNA synthetase
MKTSEDIRNAFLSFWTSPPRNAKVIPNVSLVPNNDPTLLFVNSGMFPLVPYLSGQPHPLGKRLCNVQRCLRTNDINDVGDYNHLTFFEMIGNWSLGAFSKTEQILWKMELYVEHFGLDPKRIFASVWKGDEKIPRDTEAIEAWIKAFSKYGIEAKFSEDITKVPQGDESSDNWKFRIFPYGKEHNWWQRGPAVLGELGGPSSEIFYDMGDVLNDTNEPLHINDDSGRYLEIGNSVFMEYKFGQNDWEQLQQKNIDFGGGLDRIIATVQNKRSVYETDLFTDYINAVESISGYKYDPTDTNSNITKAFRIIADHARASTFILADGVIPGNKDQGYILRRLIRRMIRHGKVLGIQKNFTKDLAQIVINKMHKSYPHLKEKEAFIINEIEKEEIKFRRTLDNGIKQFYKIIDTIRNSNDFKRNYLTGQEAFHLYETYGFPVEMTQELCDEIGFDSIDKEDFEKELQKHQEKSRTGAKQKFIGGLADHSEETTKLHTAHHLLLRALQIVLGDDIHQKGSNITSERLRIDFNYSEKLTPQQIEEIEKIINEKIKADLPVKRIEMPLEQAKKIGAEMEFGQKYPEMVSVYFIGDSLENAFSKEFCGGPHVESTGKLADGGKNFKIIKQENIGSGLRRIKATLI